MLLSNIWTCLRGNQTSIRFRCAPPEVEKYLQLDEDEEAANGGGETSTNESMESEGSQELK